MKKCTLTTISFVASIIGFTLSTTNSYAEIYKWTDKNGQIHYSATPPVQKVKAKEIGEEIRMSVGKFNPTNVTGNEEQDSSAESEDSADKLADKSSDKKQAPTKELINFCKSQRSNLDLLKKNQNITWEQFGKKTNLTQEQRKAKINSIKSTITEECKGI